MSRRSFRPREPVLATVRIGSPFLRPAQSRASRPGADAPSPLALPLSAQTDPRVAASRPARRMRDSARTRAFSRLSQLYPAPTHGSPFCEWHRQLALAATRPRSRRCPISCSSRHICRAPRHDTTRLGRSRLPEYRHPPTLRLGASHRRRMLAAIPRLQPHQATATARRPSVRIAQPRSVPFAIALVTSIVRLLGSRTSGFRLVGSSPIALPPISTLSRDFAEISEPSCPNPSPLSLGPANRVLMVSPGPSHRCRKFVSRSPNMLRLSRKSCFSTSMRYDNTSLRMQRFTPVHADACGREPEPPDRPVKTVQYINDTRAYRAFSCRRDRS